MTTPGPKTEKESIYPYLRFILIGGRRPFPWDNKLENLEVYIDDKQPVVPPPLIDTVEGTNYLNRFLRAEPENLNSDSEPLAVAIIKAIAFPHGHVRRTLDAQGLEASFIDAISNACAVTAIDDDIRGGELARIYRFFPPGNLALANCVAVLIGFHIGKNKGGMGPFQLRHLTGRSIQTAVKKLCAKYVDFEIYYQAIVQDPQTNEHLADVEVAPAAAPAEAVQASRPRRLRQPRRPKPGSVPK